jgi:hypothetical protein
VDHGSRRSGWGRLKCWVGTRSMIRKSGHRFSDEIMLK